MQTYSEDLNLVPLRERQVLWRLLSLAAKGWSQVKLFNEGTTGKRWRKIHLRQTLHRLRKTWDHNQICSPIYTRKKRACRTKMENYCPNERRNAHWQWTSQWFLGRNNGDRQLPLEQAPYKKQKPWRINTWKSLNRQTPKPQLHPNIWKFCTCKHTWQKEVKVRLPEDMAKNLHWL